MAPWHNNAPCLARYHALSELANGVAIVAGGILLDHVVNTSQAGRIYAHIFLLACIARTLLVALAARIIEPGARPLGKSFAITRLN